MEDLKYKIAITLLQGVGTVRTRTILGQFHSLEAFFTEKESALLHISGISKQVATRSARQKALEQAIQEISFVEDNHLRVLWFLDDDYPSRLKQCEDAPVLLYMQGEADLHARKVLSIVGTRHATPYGIDHCNNIIEELAASHPGLLIVSGLAYGIDVCAHKAALKYGLPTIAVLGHGLQIIYPASHRRVAGEIVRQGALLTEYSTFHTPEKKNFIARNRIIAGLADATLVVESGEKGGALITADLANSYNRDVFALPGRAGDEWSRGCNHLIKKNMAALVENADDLAWFLGWEMKNTPDKTVQKELFLSLGDEEQLLLDILKEQKELPLDELSVLAGMPVSKTSALLLNLEFAGMVKSLPGNIFRWLP
jgi:DNA processing protein